MSCWIPSPWSPRVPGAGWLAQDRWRKEEVERKQVVAAAKAPDFVPDVEPEVPMATVAQRVTSARASSQTRRSTSGSAGSEIRARAAAAAKTRSPED